MENKGKYYLTTAIAYASGKPHIGNTYEIILADAICRFKRNEGYDVRFQTGSDEHGQKIEDKAKAAGMEPQAFVDQKVAEIQGIFDLVDTSYDRFMRTTDHYHEGQVQKIFRKLHEKGDIYKSSYEGMYCKDCESFYTESQLVDGKCPDCGANVTKEREEAYFFKMSNYADRLLKHIEENPEFIQPESRKNEMINNFIKPGLQDLCVSRTSFKWGIPVDFDPKHVVYVWIDALTNYITGLGYDVDGNHGELYKKYWPADVHLIGKDILRFHTIYWPIMLMALDIPLPKQVFGHPWLLVGDGKMSKSKGNAIYADDLVKYFGVDAVRYFCLHEMPFGNDGTITYELMIERFNSHLVNIFGNLVNRTISMTNKYFEGVITKSDVTTDFDENLKDTVLTAVKNCQEHMDKLRVADAIDDIFDIFKRCNKYIDETEPWVLAKDPANNSKLQTVLYNLFEGIRIGTVLLEAFLPSTAKKALDMVGTQVRDFDSITSWGNLESGLKVIEKPEIIFNRIDAEAYLKQIVEEQEAKKPQVKIEHKPEISIEDFDKIELVVGEVKECEKHPSADKLLVFKVDLGNGEIRQIVSGIAKWYKEPAKLVGRKVAVVANLKPVKLRGVESQGMLLSEDFDGNVSLVLPNLEVGAKIC